MMEINEWMFYQPKFLLDTNLIIHIWVYANIHRETEEAHFFNRSLATLVGGRQGECISFILIHILTKLLGTQPVTLLECTLHLCWGQLNISLWQQTQQTLLNAIACQHSYTGPIDIKSCKQFADRTSNRLFLMQQPLAMECVLLLLWIKSLFMRWVFFNTCHEREATLERVELGKWTRAVTLFHPTGISELTWTLFSHPSCNAWLLAAILNIWAVKVLEGFQRGTFGCQIKEVLYHNLCKPSSWFFR